MKKRILILGAGFAGMTLATELKGIAEAEKAEVTLVEKNRSFSVGFSMQWALAGRRNLDEFQRPYSSLQARHAEFIGDEITAIDTKERTVCTKSHAFHYDYLVVALGAEACPETVPGLAEAAYNLCDANSVMELKNALENISEGRIVIMVSSVPFKCPPMPYEYALFIDEILRKRGVRDMVRIAITTPEAQPMPIAGKLAGDSIKSLMESRGVEFMPHHKPEHVDSISRSVSYEGKPGLDYSILCAVPPYRAPKIAIDAGMTDDSGFIPCEIGSFRTKFPGIFAAGDCAAIKLPDGRMHPKAGVFAELQAKTLAEVINAEISGEEYAPEYEGKGSCFIDTGNNEAARAEISLLDPGGPKVLLGSPSAGGLEEKRLFEAERLKRWFGF